MLSMIRNLRLGSQWLWLLMFAGLAVRFAWVAAQPVLAEREKPAVPDPAELARQAKAAADAVAKTIAPAVEKPPVVEAPAEEIRLMLLVKHSQSRSRVMINGAFVGQTTYASDISCKRGEPLEFQIIPPHGKPVERHYKCEGQTLVVSE